MFTEPVRAGSVSHRASIHAALGDPARLAIAEALTIGDASPSELQATLHLPSNLMAHHLRVLERVGLLIRRRSERDRRRTYLHLDTRTLGALTPDVSLPARRVVFVCTGNSARSQLAVALWGRQGPVHAESAGTRPATRVHPGAVAAAARRRLPMQPSRPRALDGVLQPDDLVITVCDSAHEESGRAGEWLHWSVPDPVPADDHTAFDQTLDDLADRITRLRPTIRTVA